MAVCFSFIRVFIQHTSYNRMHALFEDIDAWGLSGRTGMHITWRFLTLPFVVRLMIDRRTAVDSRFLRIAMEARFKLPPGRQNFLGQNFRIAFFNLANIWHIRPLLRTCPMFARFPRRFRIMDRLMDLLCLRNCVYTLLRCYFPIQTRNLGKEKKKKSQIQ